MKIDRDKLNKRLAEEKKLILQRRKRKMGNTLVVTRLDGMLLGIAMFKTYLEECEVKKHAKN